MALFGIFKSRHEREQEDVSKRYNKMLFPMGEADVDRDCQHIDALTKGKIPANELRDFVTGCKMLVFISSKVGDDYDDDAFVNSFVNRSGHRISEAEARDLYVYLAGIANSRNLWVLQGKSLSPDIVNEFDRLEKVWAVGATTDTIPAGYGDFGLTRSNPIPTICIRGSNRYLARLRHNEKPVEHKRVGSTSSDVTAGTVDIYELSQGGRKLCAIYICPYHRKDSKLAPKGFTLSSMPPEVGNN